MRRWNGWGDEHINYPLPPSASRFLQQLLGPGTEPHDITLGDAVAKVPPSRLPPHPLVTAEGEARLRHTCGQSLPDWIAIRSGSIPAFADGVAFPSTEEEVASLIAFATQTGAQLIPYGGGTSVVGHIEPSPGDRPALTVDMSRLSHLLSLDETSWLATFGAGARGPYLEAQLQKRGYTLGHFPQSFEFSTLGGWIATRSSGQQSLYYGRIEDMFAGGKLVSPVGRLSLPPLPASAAGPDLRQLALGSEGRLGIITQATVRIRSLPAREEFGAIFFRNWEQGITAMREMVQARLPLSMLRLSDPAETTTTLTLAGHEKLVNLLEGWLRFRGLESNRCMLLFAASGEDKTVKSARRQAIDAARAHGGIHIIHVGKRMGEEWRKNRFRTPYLRNTLWKLGYAVDTLETAIRWSEVPATANAIRRALQDGLSEVSERVHVFGHLSHVYADGASIYVTYLFRLPQANTPHREIDPDETLRRWRLLKGKASDAIVKAGGTISHQHGVGAHHAPYLPAEKGELGLTALHNLCQTFDPEGIMNPKKLIDWDSEA